MVLRTRLANRHYSETFRVKFTFQGGKEQEILVTFGFDDETSPRYVREIFCADFKAGSDFHLLAVDACILVSRLLQQGNSAQELFNAVGRPLSLIGVLLRAAADCEREFKVNNEPNNEP